MPTATASRNAFVEENFSIEFGGPVFDKHEISIGALAQSLLAFDSLVRTSAEVLYGKGAEIDIKVTSGFRPGSFFVALLVPVDQGAVLVGTTSISTILCDVICLAKWAHGKAVKVLQQSENGSTVVENVNGQTAIFNNYVVNIYSKSATSRNISRLTQTLDVEGAETVRIISEHGTEESITRQDRQYLRNGDSLVLTDNEAETILEVIGPKFNGSPDGWTFSEGDGGHEFVAVVEDENFLAKVCNKEVPLGYGTTIRAIVRTVQKRKVRTTTTRTIAEVLEVMSPDEQSR